MCMYICVCVYIYIYVIIFAVSSYSDSILRGAGVACLCKSIPASLTLKVHRSTTSRPKFMLFGYIHC